ncbi:MAG: GNAT family N-acetyltransferase [Fibrobacter sp.]|jgi:ribosomal-protein-alanine N-acetyltransferase|nr:GNAT family N-acetyltransferase [Fibrobacter sp.]
MPVREMTESDLKQVLEIQRELSFQDWNEAQFKAEIKASYALCVVYETESRPEAEMAEGNIIGYAVFHLLGSDSELLSIATKAAEQRKGTGTELLKAGLSRLDFGNGDRMFLEVREGNEKARRFYEHHGFEAFGKRNNYYADGETAILYRKTT